jgi:RNA polymerase sigma-70 factor (ECF subfamily)
MEGFFDNERFRKLLLSFPAKAIEFLYAHYYQSLVAIAKTLTHSVAAAEDIVQETFVHVWENAAKLSQYHERSIQYFLVKVVRNKAITHYKKTLTLNDLIIKAEYYNAQNTNDPSAEAELIKAEVIEDIRNYIKTFPRKERECLLMKIDENLSTEHIALRLKVTKKAVERSITSAYKRLRRFGLSQVSL